MKEKHTTICEAKIFLSAMKYNVFCLTQTMFIFNLHHDLF